MKGGCQPRMTRIARMRRLVSVASAQSASSAASAYLILKVGLCEAISLERHGLTCCCRRRNERRDDEHRVLVLVFGLVDQPVPAIRVGHGDGNDLGARS